MPPPGRTRDPRSCSSNFRDNRALARQGFAPLGKVIEAMDTVERFYGSYGDMAPTGISPDATQIEQQGKEYLGNHFPRLDYIRKATVQ